MTTAVQEALSPDIEERLAIRQNCLKLLLRSRMEMLLPRPTHLDREIIIGLIGQRGEGKSASGASISLVDFMVDGIPCYSNMAIACKMLIEDDIARDAGFKRSGVVEYRSRQFNKAALLRKGADFANSLLFIDEINVEFSEARRSMSNTNLFFNRLIQELRHYKISLIFTAISEMHIDSRLRELTDVFIKVEDTALSMENLARKKPSGTDFKWVIYPMSRILTGQSYYVTHKHLPPRYFSFVRFRGIYDDKEVQAEGMSKYGIDLSKLDGDKVYAEETLTPAPFVSEFDRKWGWLAPIADEMLHSGEKFLRADEYYNNPEVKRRKIPKGKLTELLETYYQITTERKSVGAKKRTFYILPDEPLGGRLTASAEVGALSSI